MSELIHLSGFTDEELENMLRVEKNGLTRAALREVLLLRCDNRAAVLRNGELRQQNKRLEISAAQNPPAQLLIAPT